MHIAIDFDNVLFDTNGYLLQQYNELNGTDFSIDDVTDVTINSLIGMDQRLFERFAVTTMNKVGIEQMVPSQSAIDTIPELAHMYNLSILSERYQQAIPFFQHWVNLYFPKTFQYVFCTNGFPKHQVYNSVGFDLLVDDDKNEVHGAHKLEHAAVLYGRPWNADVEMSYRMRDWEDLKLFLY